MPSRWNGDHCHSAWNENGTFLPLGVERNTRGRVMELRTLDVVVLARDLPNHGLRKGDLGAVVHVYPPDDLEVEFVTAAGKTKTVVTLTRNDVREVRDNDLISVRSIETPA